MVSEDTKDTQPLCRELVSATTSAMIKLHLPVARHTCDLTEQPVRRSQGAASVRAGWGKGKRWQPVE